MPYRTENWGKRGKVTVTRDAKGRFVSWKPMINTFSYGFSRKSVAVYGYCITEEGKSSRRYEFSGDGRAIYQAVALAQHIVPKKRFVTINAEAFIDDPYVYGTEGYWIDRPEINS